MRSRSGSAIAAWLMMLAPFAAGCATVRCASQNAGSCSCRSSGGAPRIEALRPDSASAHPAQRTAVTVIGCGFADTSNTVLFGATPVGGLPSHDGGTRIEFFIPMMVLFESDAPPAPLPPGQYQVAVRTASGTSKAVPFTLTP